ncbi:hypothetical protein JXA84_01655 [candidate division WOR-3 bacterium]|nr:hypothetical protein [candidate division WOR-3 bacterium]
MKRYIPLAITFLSGMMIIASFYVPRYPIGEAANTLKNWYMVVAVFSMILGILNLIRVNSIKIMKKRKGWIYSSIIIFSLLVTVFAGWGGGMEEGSAFDYIFSHFYTPLNATMFSLLAFFVASASFRAFRARNLEAGLLLLAAILVMLGRVPIGKMIFPYLPSVQAWIMEIPNTAGQRAIMIGAALGVISTSLRIIFGIERSYLN